MYGLLHSANRRLAHLAAAPYSERFLRAFSSTAGIDDLVYVGKGYKIFGKDEIESEISESYTHCRRKLNNERKMLPPELQSRNVVKLTCDSSAAGGICDVYLIGTEHFWPESWREVRNVISFLKPEVVFLELCSKRLDVLKGQQKVPTIGGLFELWKNNEDPFWILHLWFRAKMSNQPCDDWPTEKFGVTYEEAMKYGVKVMLGERPDHSSNQQECSESNEWLSGEFGVAYKEAMKYGGKVVLGDRPDHISVQREYAALSPWVSLYELDYWLCDEDFLETVKDDIEYVKLVAEVDKKLSTHTEVVVGERDRYMSAKIQEVAREHSSVVAVVGLSHLPGIQEYWKQPVDMKELLNIPAGNIATMGKLLNTFAAMVTFLFLSESQRNKIRAMMVAFYSRRLKMKSPKLGWWPKSPRH